MSGPYTERGVEQSFDEIAARINNSLPAVASLLGEQMTVLWPGFQTPTAMPANQFWARVSTKNVRSEQIGFSSERRRSTTWGLAFVQIFCPRTDGAIDRGRRIADLFLANSFRTRPVNANVLFRNVRSQDIAVASDDTFYQINVIAEYQYDEIT